MLEINHLSYSSINAWLLCPRSWRYRYVDKVETPKSANLVFGSCFHETIESYLRGQCQGTMPDILSTWQRLWNSETAEATIDWGDSTPEQLSNDGVQMLTHKDTTALFSTLQPLMENGEPVIEHKVTLRVPGVPLPIIGYIDMRDVEGVPYDFKTSARAWTLDKVDGELQPLFYLAALAQAGDRLNPKRRFKHLVFVKTKTPQVQTLEAMHSAAELLWLMDLIRSVWLGIQAEAFPPNVNGWKCSARYCEFWAYCRGRTLCMSI